MYLAGIYCDPRTRSEASLEEVFAGEYSEEDWFTGKLPPAARGTAEDDEEEVTTVASLENSLCSSTTIAAAPAAAVLLPSQQPPASKNANSILGLARAIWLLCNQQCEERCPQEPVGEADLHLVFEWVTALQREEESRRNVVSAAAGASALVGEEHVERVLAAALAISKHAHQRGALTACSVPGVAAQPAERCGSAERLSGSGRVLLSTLRSSGASGRRLIGNLGLGSFVSRATTRAVGLLTATSSAAALPGYEEESGAAPGEGRTASVKFRDCGAILKVIATFCYALLVGSAWVDEAAPLSTLTLAKFLMEAAETLSAARSCAPRASSSCDRAAARFRRLASQACFRPAPVPCSLCVKAPLQGDVASAMVSFEQSLCQFLSSINYETRIADSDTLKVHF